MDWIEINVSTTTAGAELVSYILEDLGAKGVWIEDKNDVLELISHSAWELADNSLADKMPEDVAVKAYYPQDIDIDKLLANIRSRLDDIKSGIQMDMGALCISHRGAKNDDWAENWKKYYKPFAAGEKLMIKPSWEDAPQTDRVVIQIDPGAAFGAGTHETTLMCLELLEKAVYPGAAVIDVGTGTGILAIAAAKLGAGSVMAIDIDSVAVRVARENIQLNGLDGRIGAQTGDLLTGVSGDADIIIANIIADAIIAIAPGAKKHLNSPGKFIVSGIINSRESDVISALEENCFQIAEIKRMGEWVAICAQAL